MRRRARTSSAASRLAAYPALPSQPISTRAASRHRLVADGFRWRFVAFVVVSACDGGRRAAGSPRQRLGRQRLARREQLQIFFCDEPNACKGKRRVNVGGSVVVTAGEPEQLNKLPNCLHVVN